MPYIFMKNIGGKYLFIFGVGRSGTTYLSVQLARYKEFVGVEEHHFIRSVLGRRIEPFLLEDIEKTLFWGSLKEDNRQLLRNSGCRFTAEELLDQIYKDSEKLRLDKDPKLIQSLDLIKKSFNDYELLWIQRDIRAVLASKMKADWSKKKGLVLNLLISIFQYNIGLWEKLLGNHKIHIVQYNELITDTEAVIEDLLNKLNIRSSGVENKSLEGMIRKEERWKQNSLNKADSTRIESWKSSLSRCEIFLCELCCVSSIKQNRKFTGLKYPAYLISGLLFISSIGFYYLFKKQLLYRI